MHLTGEEENQEKQNLSPQETPSQGEEARGVEGLGSGDSGRTLLVPPNEASALGQLLPAASGGNGDSTEDSKEALVAKSRPAPKFYSIDEYLKLPRNPQKWIVDKLIPYGGYTNVFAKAKTGKSYLMLGIIWSICNGDPDWEGFPILTHGNVMYLQVDTPREEWADRLLKMQKALLGRKHEFSIADMWTVPSYPFNLLRKKEDAPMVENGEPVTDQEWLKREVERLNPILIVIDTIREIHEEDEDKSGAMKKVLSAITAAAGPGRAVVIVSHSRKDNMLTAQGQDDMMDQNRGSNYIPGKMDMIIKLTKKLMIWKGRAVGLKQVEYKQDHEGWIRIQYKDEDKAQTETFISEIFKQTPNMSQTKAAEILVERTKMSLRTCQRRISEWISKQQEREQLELQVERERLVQQKPKLQKRT